MPIRLKDVPRQVPVGLGILANILRNAGHEVRMLDLNALRLSKPELEKRLAELGDSAFIGISGMISTYKFQKDLINRIKELYPKTLVISGGSAATSVPELLLSKTKLDVAAIGEGEKTILEIAEHVAGKRDLKDVKGIMYRKGKKFVKNPPQEWAKLDELPWPAYDLMELDIYFKHHNVINEGLLKKRARAYKSMNIISTRGCPFNCGFCYHLFGRGRIRYRDPKDVAAEVKFLKDTYGVDFIDIIDDNTTVNKKFLEELSGLLKELDVHWACASRVSSLDEKTVKLLVESNCKLVGVGIESGSPRILKNMNKQSTTALGYRAVKLCRKYGLSISPTFIFGYSGENFSSMLETATFMGKAGIINQFFTITAYPGTPLFEDHLADMRNDLDKYDTYVEQLDDARYLLHNFTEWDDKTFHRMKDLQFKMVLAANVLFSPILSAKVIGRKILRSISS
ncbi:MAG: B12-binding domain-containing radical SAM protein [Candidatus Woesearchaeota archaeon]|nr:MAG: B12-binding domain-containing radical SAM protein [Candidatus Woesearchaeota archaeon]